MIQFKQRGDFSKLDNFFKRASNVINMKTIRNYCEEGIRALEKATPKDTGLTSKSWSYEITQNNGLITIYFLNSNVNKGIPIAIILQYGHATRNGGWVEGIDYINPAIKPIFEKIADDSWDYIINTKRQ